VNTLVQGNADVTFLAAQFAAKSQKRNKE